MQLAKPAVIATEVIAAAAIAEFAVEVVGVVCEEGRVAIEVVVARAVNEVVVAAMDAWPNKKLLARSDLHLAALLQAGARASNGYHPHSRKILRIWCPRRRGSCRILTQRV